MEERALVVHDPNQSLTLQKVSQGLFKSGLFPNAKNEFGAFSIVEYGHELGIPPMMSLKNINIISGQLACNAQLMLSLAIAKGVTYEVLEESDKGAKIRFKRGQAAPYESSFNEEDAKAAGLLGKDNWKKYPRDMYFWRAVAKGIRRIAPDAVMGLYTAEEITEGNVVDITESPKSAAAPDDVQDYEDISDSFTKDEASVKTQAEKDRAHLEILIQKAKFDRDKFKDWLVSVQWLPAPEGYESPSMKGLPDAKVAELITDVKWKQAMGLYSKWLKEAAA